MATTTIPQLNATVREKLGTRYTKRIREQGQMPAVVYGHGQDPLHVAVDYKELVDLLHHNAHLVELHVGSEVEPCLIKEVQWNHLSTKIIHADLTRVNLNEKVTVSVSIELHGDAPGLEEDGAIMEQPLTELEIECLATNIPELIEVNVSAMQVGDNITVEDIKLPEGVEAVTDNETVICHIAVVQEISEDEIAGGDDADAAEPEVIGREDEEGDAEEGEEKTEE